MTVSLGHLTFLNVILCEDARQDINNKFILIGVFSEDILLSEIPGNLPVAFYVEVKSENAGEQLLHLKISGPGESSAIIKARVTFYEAGRVGTLATPQLTIGVTEEGTFRLDVSLDEEEWVNLLSKKISKGVVASAWRQPSEQSPPDAPESSSQP